VNKYSLAGPTAAYVKIIPDNKGQIVVHGGTSCVNLGQGSSTALSQIVAEEFRIPIGRVNLTVSDTAVTPFDTGTFSSRVTFHAGNAFRLACKDAVAQIFKAASDFLGVDAGQLETEKGIVYVKSEPDRSISIADLFNSFGESGFYWRKAGEIVGRALYEGGLKEDGGWAASFFTHCANGIEVEVNVETGEIRIIQIASAVEVGKAINPLMARGQMYGGIAMGCSTTLFEELIQTQDGTRNSHLADYKLATSCDLPTAGNIKVILMEQNPHRSGPYGAKGIGEVPVVGIAPAIANAVQAATGIRVTSLPITTETLCNFMSD